MRTSEKGINLIKKFEGLRLTAYRCSANALTIGYGHTKNVKENDTITQTQADIMLNDDLFDVEKYVNAVNEKFNYNFNQNEFDALVSFTFNCGRLNLIKLIRDGLRTKQEIAEAFMLYINAKGKPLKGLVNRRLAEKSLFLTGEEVEEIKISKDCEKLTLEKIAFVPELNYNIRAGASMNSQIIGNTNNVEYVHIIGEKNDYFLCDVGWISKDAFEVRS